MSGVVVVNQLSSQIVNDDGYSAVLKDGYSTIGPNIAGVMIAGKSGSNANILNIDGSGRILIPTGAATEASLAKLTISQNTALGSNTQAMVGGSVTTTAPAYITGQISPISLTTAGSVRIDGSGITQPISGTVTANAGTGNFTVAQATGLNLHTVLDSGTLTTVSTVTNLAQLGGFAISMNTGVRDTGTQRVTIATNDIVAVSQSGTWSLNNISGTINLPTGAATQSTLSTLLTEATFTNRINTLGQKDSNNSVPVVISSNQSAVQISGTDGYTTKTIKTNSDGIMQVAFSATGANANQIQGVTADGNPELGNPVLMGGTDSTNTRAILTDMFGRIVIAPAGTAATTSGFAPGYVATAAATQAIVRATVYTEQTTNAQRSVVSTSALDTAAGTGARTIKITYYNDVWGGPFTETIALNGITAVNTVNTNICLIESMEIQTVGSGNLNAGIISLRTTVAGGGSTIGSISIGDNRTFWSHHYTPAGKTTYITSVSVGHNGTTVGSGALYILRAKDISLANASEKQISDFIRLYGQSSTLARNFGTAIQVSGPARIAMYVTPESATSLTFRGAFDFYDQ